MANEFQMSLSVSCLNSGFADNFNFNGGRNQATLGELAGTFLCVPTGAALPITSVGTAGYACFQNLDTTNSIVLLNGTTPFCQMDAGDPSGPIKLFPGISLFAKSVSVGTGGTSANLQFKVFSR